MYFLSSKTYWGNYPNIGNTSKTYTFIPFMRILYFPSVVSSLEQEYTCCAFDATHCVPRLCMFKPTKYAVKINDNKSWTLSMHLNNQTFKVALSS